MIGFHLKRKVSLRVALACTVLALVPGVACSGGGEPTNPTLTPTQPAPTQGTESPTTPAATGWVADGVVSPGEYANQVDEGSYRLFWTSTADTIRIAMQADAQGWVAVGFQPGSRMKDADVVLGAMSGGQAVVQDQFSTGDFGPHNADVDQGGTDDLMSFGGARTSTTTTFEFERKLSTGDALDVPLGRGAAMQIIWAFGESDDVGMKHGTRGYSEITP